MADTFIRIPLTPSQASIWENFTNTLIKDQKSVPETIIDLVQGYLSKGSRENMKDLVSGVGLSRLAEKKLGYTVGREDLYYYRNRFWEKDTHYFQFSKNKKAAIVYDLDAVWPTMLRLAKKKLTEADKTISPDDRLLAASKTGPAKPKKRKSAKKVARKPSSKPKITKEAEDETEETTTVRALGGGYF